MVTVWSLCVCAAVHHADIISHLHHSRHYHCRLLHADRYRHLAPVILHYDHSSRRVKQQTTSQSHKDLLVHVGYTCIQTIQSWTWGPILLDPIQLNPQTYWPNQIQSTLNSSWYRIVSYHDWCLCFDQHEHPIQSIVSSSGEKNCHLQFKRFFISFNWCT